jgi:hypothetical protein
MLSRWDATVEYTREYARYDLVLFDESKELFAAFEFKRWMSNSGEREVPSFVTDLQKLREAPCQKTAFVVFSSNKRGAMEENICWLEDQWTRGNNLIPMLRRYTYCFGTISPWTSTAEFWIGVWPVKGGGEAAGAMSVSGG